MLALQTEIRAKELMQMGVGVRLATIGKKATQYFKRRADQYDLSGGEHSVVLLRMHVDEMHKHITVV